jgi:hypothetical protein
VFEKGNVTKPHAERTGSATVKDPNWRGRRARRRLLRRS